MATEKKRKKKKQFAWKLEDSISNVYLRSAHLIQFKSCVVSFFFFAQVGDFSFPSRKVFKQKRRRREASYLSIISNVNFQFFFFSSILSHLKHIDNHATSAYLNFFFQFSPIIQCSEQSLLVIFRKM